MDFYWVVPSEAASLGGLVVRLGPLKSPTLPQTKIN